MNISESVPIYLGTEYINRTGCKETIESILFQMDMMTSPRCPEKGIPAEMSKDYAKSVCKSTSFAKKAFLMLKESPDPEYERILKKWISTPHTEYGKILLKASLSI